MLALFVDTSTPAITAALVEIISPNQVLVKAQAVTINARGHVEQLTAGITRCYRQAGLSARDCSAVVAGCGPGPYTGLRVAITSAIVYADALGIACYGINSLDAIAASYRPATDGHYVVATDARRRELYWSVFRAPQTANALPVRIHGPAVAKPDEVASYCLSHSITCAVGTDAHRIADLAPTVVVDPEGPLYPDPAGAVLLVADRILSGAQPAPVQPLYLRRPDAMLPAAASQIAMPQIATSQIPESSALTPLQSTVSTMDLP